MVQNPRLINLDHIASFGVSLLTVSVLLTGQCLCRNSKFNQIGATAF